MQLQNNQRSVRARKLTATAMFCAMAYVCAIYLKIKIQFLTLDFKDSLIVLCSLLFGPVWGFSIAVTVPFLEFITVSDTGIYGFIMNALSSVTFSLVTGLIYRYKKSMLGAVIGLVSGVFAVTAVMVLANLFITPHFIGGTTADVAAMIPKLLLPFNLIKAILNAAFVLLLYKPLSKILKKIGFVQSTRTDGAQAEKKSVWRTFVVTGIAIAVIIVSLLILFLVIGK